jgi:hypothetical protein
MATTRGRAEEEEEVAAFFFSFVWTRQFSSRVHSTRVQPLVISIRKKSEIKTPKSKRSQR